ncbi:MAG: ATP-binding protein [Chromatiales bacterium]|jgi:lon-related putative ATP-dependent protease
MPPVAPLPPEQLYQSCVTDKFSFESSDDLEDLQHMLGQQRAVEAIELGANLQLDGFNLFVLGPPGTGRHSFIKQFLSEKAAQRPVPSDWCYVNNFDEPRKPRAIELPAGRGRHFRDDIAKLIEEAVAAIPAAFESEDYHNRRQAIENEADEEQEKAFREVQEHARERGIGIAQTATGFDFIPLHEGKAISPDDYRKLPQEEREKLQQATEVMHDELRKMLQAIPRRVREVREKIHKLDREVALFAISNLIGEILQEYAVFPKVIEFLEELQQDIAEHIDLFSEASEKQSQSLKEVITGRRSIDHESTVARRYGINLLVDRSDAEGAPVVFEDHPSYPYLIGQIEHIASLGTLMTDFSLLRPGALHRANGGYLVIDVRKLLVQPFAWDALKRALKSRVIDIKSLSQVYSLVSTVSLEPEPIPLDIKLVLIGDRLLYYLLQQYDPEFAELFKVAADFEDDMDRSPENVQHLAQLIATIARREQLRPLDKQAIARVIEESARHAGDAEMLSTQVRQLADVVREAHYWAGQNNHDHIGADDVVCAIAGRRRRMSRLHDRLQRETLRNTIMIDTDGEIVGQVNGLAVMQLGEDMFGRPTRITARLGMGSGEVIDIEREVELGGPIHSKGVLILSSYLASHYVIDRPLAFSASLVFEQSYGPIEGDSASAAELCALLSSLAEAPISQSLAITGSVNQLGQVQAIGGVNQKIEGFFELCQARGLSGKQGVLIPAANVKHLMLRQEVVDAVSNQQFSIYAVNSIDECMQLLTGLEVGQPDAEGNLSPDSLNYRIIARLLELSEQRRQYAAEGKDQNPA